MTDGYVGESGVAAWAFVARAAAGGLDITHSGTLPARTPSHMAEWAAASAALAWCEATLERGDSIELRTDSALVAKGLASRRPALSGEAAETRAACRQTLARLAAAGVRAKVVRVRREENAEADAAARAAATHENTEGTKD